MLLAGVICPNMVLSSKMLMYDWSVSSELSVAVPKYSFPFDLARRFSLACEVDTVSLAEVVGVKLEVTTGIVIAASTMERGRTMTTDRWVFL